MTGTSGGNREQILAQAKLLFRAAAWVSLMDSDGGTQSHMQERNAIRATLRVFLSEKDYIPISPVFHSILDMHRAWDEWSKDLGGLTSELRAAKPGMTIEMRQCIYDLAYSVAIQYRERSLLLVFIAALRRSLKNFLKPDAQSPELDDYLSISPTEKSALNELAEILDMPQRVID